MGGSTAHFMRNDLQGGQVGGREEKQGQENYFKFAVNETVSWSFLPSREPARKHAAPLSHAQERGHTVTP